MKKVLLAFLFMASVAVVQADFTLDWTAVDYTDGSLLETFTNVDGSGVDMTFTWSNGAPDPGLGLLFDNLPDDEDALWPTYPAAEPGLWYATNNSGDISLVITFSELVSNVSFGIYDIDGNVNNVESVRIKGFDALGNPVDLSNYAVGNGSHVQIYTDGTAAFGYQFKNLDNYDKNPGEAGWEESMGIISIDSGVELSKVGIAFVNNDGARGQILTNISFVPEPATMLLMGLGSAALLLKRKR
jgi:hypothetical protein